MREFDWSIWIKKGIKKGLLGAIIGGLSEVAAYAGTEPVPTAYIWVTIVIIEGIELILNAIKHKYM